MIEEFEENLSRLNWYQRKIIRYLIVFRLYRRSIWLIGYPSGVILLSMWLAPGEKIVLFAMSVISIVYARLAIKLLKW